MKFLEVAEEKNHKMITRMLQVQLTELQEQNALKEQQFMEIQKWKVSTLKELSQLENKFAASVSFSFLNYIFWYLLVCLLIAMSYLYIYIYVMLILCHVLFWFYDRKDKNIPS